MVKCWLCGVVVGWSLTERCWLACWGDDVVGGAVECFFGVEGGGLLCAWRCVGCFRRGISGVVVSVDGVNWEKGVLGVVVLFRDCFVIKLNVLDDLVLIEVCVDGDGVRC